MRWLPGALATQTRQPLAGSQGNCENPITGGLVYLYVPNRGAGGIVSGGSPVVGVTGTVATENWGQSGFELPPSAGLGGLVSSAQTFLVVGTPSTASFAILLSTASGQFRRWSNTFAIIGASGGRSVATGAQWTAHGVIVAQAPADASNFSAFRMFRDGRLVTDNTNNLGASVNSNPAQVFQGAAGDRSSATYWAAPTALIAKWDRYLSDQEIAFVSANPWQIVAAPHRPLWAPSAPITVSISRPGTDLSVTGWTFTGASSVAGAINEAAASDVQFATSPDLTSPATISWDVPRPAGNVTVRFRHAMALGTIGQLRVVLLDAGGNPVGQTPWQAAPASATTYTFPGVVLSATSTQFRIETQP